MSQGQTVVGDARGKHRIVAELKRMEQEARFLELDVVVNGTDDKRDLFQSVSDNMDFGVLISFTRCIFKEELVQLEKMDMASAVCQELLFSVESRPDPLLPITNGPLNPACNRWFEGPQERKPCRCRCFCF